MLSRLRHRSQVVLRKFHGRLEAFWNSVSRANPGLAMREYHGSAMLSGAFALLAVLLVPLLVLGALAFALHAPAVLALGALGKVALADAAVVTTRPLTQILKELKALQQKFVGKPMPAEDANKFEELAAEAKGMQDEADRERQIKGFELNSRVVDEPALPGADPVDKDKKGDERAIAGYIDAGTLFTQSELYAKFIEAGMPGGGAFPGVFEIPRMVEHGGRKYVPMTRMQRKVLADRVEAMEKKGVFTTTVNTPSSVILPDRLAEIIRVTEHQKLRFRDVINTSTASSNAVEYVRLASYTESAAPVADAAAKPQAAAAYDVVSVPVRTHAVWIPVTEQQLQDAPQLADTINGELFYDLDKLIEKQASYGDGTGQNWLGFFKSTIAAARAVGGDTLIDKIRRGVTDVTVSGYEPNAVMIHPIDWETIVLLKSTTNEYIWVIVTTPTGDRLWGLNVVETVNVEENWSANTTDERNILIGDFQRGATIWDRVQAALAIGFQNDDFTKNLRTVRAERRAAFSVRRPTAFRKIQTVAPVA